MLTRFYLFIIFSSLLLPAWADDPEPVQKRKLKAVRITQAPKIDGVLNEEVWQQTEIATDFIQNRPNPGRKEEHKTEVKVVYDDLAIYIGAIMHDISPDSIARELSKRDDLGASDFFAVFFDTYNDKLNGYSFIVSPSGGQMDARYSPENEDFAWNAVWTSEAKIVGNNWVVEMKIPYSAIRFSNADVQTWGLNFMRQRLKKNEHFFWNPVNPKIDGFLNQWGTLEGLENIKSPLRLSLSPYVSGYLRNQPVGLPDKKATTSSFNGGMDVKYGINESFTLDMTLIPDFGQVQSDNRVLNLTPFEVQYNENRQFFTEGTELFNKGGFFYSRRIGQTPLNYYRAPGQLLSGEKLISNPSESKLLNATKVSGRTRQNLGIGVFNATTANMYAIAQDESGRERRILTQPLTNYNIVVLDQALKNNSYVSFINTNVMRNGHTYDANLTGALFRFANKQNKYAIEGKGSMSQKYGLNPTGKAELGYSYLVKAGKISGNFQYDVSHRVESDKYDMNDLGILYQNNNVAQSLDLRYNIFKPFWKLNRLRSGIGVEYSRRYAPSEFQNLSVFTRVFTTTKKFVNIGVFGGMEPVVTHDFYEPRIGGRYYAYPTNNSVGGFFGTDYRKKFALELNGNFRFFNENNRNRINIYVSPRYRFSNKFNLTSEFNISNWQDDMGFANGYNIGANNGRIMFGRRDLQTFSNTLRGQYTFTNRISLSLRARHYWSKVIYKDFWLLNQTGGVELNDYQGDLNNDGRLGDHDQNYNAFNVDMVFTWWFAPGSEMSLVWKNAISPDGNIIQDNYFDNLGRTLRSPQDNSLSLKILYYLDYQELKKRRK